MSKNVLEDKSRQLLRYGTAIVHCSLFIVFYVTIFCHSTCI